MIYVHVPFCRSFCTYCGFYSEVVPKCRCSEDSLMQDALQEDYISALETEIRIRQEEIQGEFAFRDVNTLYIGGGTPSMLPLNFFGRLTDALGRSGFVEYTVEVNPEDIVEKGPEYVRGLVNSGVNRISMGVQSFDDSVLKWMNRRHTAAQAVQAYHILEEAGVGNISIDLIFGFPGLTDTLWRETLDKALHISSHGVLPAHISAYQLSVEEDSVLEKMIARGMCSEAAEEDCRRQYELLCQVLGTAGYNHYEISNFARPGFEAVHNSAYWRHIPYIGLGPGAHSYIGDATRLWNKNDLSGYVEAGKTGDFSRVQDGEVLDAEQMSVERIMLGLRTSSGVQEVFLREHCGDTVVDSALRCGNLITLGNGVLRIPENRFFVSDNIISSII